MRKITDLAQTVSGLIIRPLLFFSSGGGCRIHFNYPPPCFWRGVRATKSILIIRPLVFDAG